MIVEQSNISGGGQLSSVGEPGDQGIRAPSLRDVLVPELPKQPAVLP